MKKSKVFKKLKIALTTSVLALSATLVSVPVQNYLGLEVVSIASQARIGKKSLSIKVGQKTKLKVVGTKKKAKWTSSDKTIASVDKNGNVVGISNGTAYVDAKIGKKTYSCTVNVKFDAESAKKNISVELKDTGDGVVAIIKNNNSYTLNVKANFVYFNGGSMISSDSEENPGLESKKECAVFFSCPLDSDYKKVAYDDYKISVNVDCPSGSLIPNVDGISVKSNLGANNITAEATNNSKIKYSSAVISCVMYDNYGHAIGYDWHYLDCDNPGDTDYLSFDFPEDSNYNPIIPASYEIYINSAYTYSWNL